MAKLTIQARLIAGLTAKGWTRCDTPSGRVCFTKLMTKRSKVDGSDLGTYPYWVWVGEAGSFRGAAKNAYTESHSIQGKMKTFYLTAGDTALTSPSPSLAQAAIAALKAKAEQGVK